MRFYEVSQNVGGALQALIVIEAMSVEQARDILASKWLGFESWDELTADGFDAEYFTFTHVNHGPATPYPSGEMGQLPLTGQYEPPIGTLNPDGTFTPHGSAPDSTPASTPGSMPDAFIPAPSGFFQQVNQ